MSKFSKAGVLSGLNNLRDITMVSDYSSMLGLTEEEIERRMRLWYNGYCFSGDCERVYNPFSTFTALLNKSIDNYWFESGTPTVLIELIKKRRFNFMKIPTTAKAETFSVYELENLAVFTIIISDRVFNDNRCAKG